MSDLRAAILNIEDSDGFKIKFVSNEGIDLILDAVIASLPELMVKGSLYANNFQNGRRKYHKEVVELLQSAKSTSKESDER